jgi:hypothetical protein
MRGTYVLFFSDKEGFQVVRKLIIYYPSLFIKFLYYLSYRFLATLRAQGTAQPDGHVDRS